MMVHILMPPNPLVTVEEAKVALGESGHDRDELIEMLLLAAQSELDGPNGWVGVSVAPQTAQVVAPSFEPAIRLAGGPVTGVTVLYRSASGVELTLDPTSYIVEADGTLSIPAASSWPELEDRADAVTVVYDVGIDDPDDPRHSAMRLAIIMHVRMNLDMVAPEVHRRAIEAVVRHMWVVP